jgi:hypothetical protein
MSPRRGRRSSARTAAQGVGVDAYRQRPFARSLVLLEYMVDRLGGHYGELLRRLSDTAQDSGGFVDALRTRAGRTLPDADLLRYDGNIRMHEARMAQARPDFHLTYFQWLAALLTEMTLDALMYNEAELLSALEQKRIEFASFLPEYTPGDVRKLACFMATGSGKTLLLHLNLLQFLDYGLFEPDNILLLTPNEALSAQHRAELDASGLGALDVTIVEITKFYVDGGNGRRPKKGVSEPTSRYEGPNLLLVDEGHKGGTGAAESGGEREWRAIREALAAGNTPENRGFVFEYSATFAQMAAGSAELYAEYAKCAVVDFGYARFHRDGYGKDFRILNAKATDGADLTLSAGLLSFYRQVLASAQHPSLTSEYQLAAPLWVALGKSVTAAAGSDVAELLRFLDHAASDTAWLASQIERVRGDVAAMQSSLEGDPLEFGVLKDADAHVLASDVQLHLFGGNGRLQLHLLSDHEIGLRSTGAPTDGWCGVVRVGEARKLVDQLRRAGSLIVGEPDKLAGSLFARIESDTNLRFLIGARMFVEGWSSWRVSAMALMNVGKSAGSEIVQMFGRGVRLRGKAMSLRRAGDAAPEAVRLLETLYVFGVRANYLETFVKTLRDEGVARAVHFWPLLEHAPPVDKLDLLTLAPDTTPFEEIVAPDPAKDHVRIAVDSGLTLTTGFTGTAAVGIAAETDYRIDRWLDRESFYQHALEWKRRTRNHQVVVDPETVDALAAGCSVRAPAGTFDDDKDASIARRRSELATACVERALEAAFNRARRTFYAARLQSAALTADDANFPHYDVQGRRTLAVRIEAETQHDIVASLRNLLDGYRIGGVIDETAYLRITTALSESVGVGDVSEKVQAGWKDTSATTRDDGAPPLPRLYFDRHLYAPLLVAAPFEDRHGQLALFTNTGTGVRVSPPALVESEARFVHDLREFWASAKDKPEWRDCEIYLLRNQARTGVDLFTGVGFYPDFLMWLKHGNDQVLCFVEPKGLGRAWPQAKIDLLANIEKQSPPGLPLRGFMVTPTPLPEIQKLRDQATTQSLAADRILLQGSSDDYVAAILLHLSKALTSNGQLRGSATCRR